MQALSGTRAERIYLGTVFDVAEAAAASSAEKYIFVKGRITKQTLLTVRAADSLTEENSQTEIW